MQRTSCLVLAVVGLSLAACGGDDDGGGETEDASTGTDSGALPTDGGGGLDDAGSGADDAGSGGDDGGTPLDCDFESVDGIVVIEAESLPLVEDWTVSTDRDGYSGSGYIEWTGSSHNNDPTHGVTMISLCLESAGRWRLQWRNRIGIGTNTTEHNDTWAKFPDADDYFGVRGPSDGESRRYPKPICEDDTFMTSVRDMATVSEATCVHGSTTDGWLKVYSSGASDWRWSTRTSDSDAHDVVLEVDSPGVYTLALAARAEAHLIDRIVVHEADLEDATVQDLSLVETAVE